MKADNEKIASLMINLSGLLIPISLASITFIGTGTLEGIVKNIVMVTIPAQIFLLLASLWIGLGLYNKTNENTIETHMSYCKFCFFGALTLISLNHVIVLFSS